MAGTAHEHVNERDAGDGRSPPLRVSYRRYKGRINLQPPARAGLTLHLVSILTQNPPWYHSVASPVSAQAFTSGLSSLDPP